MIARTKFRFPADGQWHKLPEFGPVLEISGPLDVTVDIDGAGRGRVMAPADGVEREVEYVLGQVAI